MSAPGRTPSVHHRALLTWLAVYPALLVVQLALGGVLAGLPLPVRTLIVTVIVVPAVVYGLVPALLRLYARLARPRRAPESEPRRERVITPVRCRA